MLRRAAFAVFAMLAAGSASAREPLSLSQALSSQFGRWEGRLEYRDYQADKWFGIPVEVTISDGGDGVTQLRIADFDDGPKVGIVRITTVAILGTDGFTEWSSSFRKGREPELTKARLTLVRAVAADRWTIVSESQARDNDRPARIRNTVTRDGDAMIRMKEVDFTDDADEVWLQRNRDTLRRVSGQ